MASTRTTTHEAFSSSSSSSSSTHWIYDVFLSFRGEDTRNSFTGHLYMALKEAGINVFIDGDELRRGEDISSELVRAIQGSRISVIVFSRRYAASTWCLEELVKIMECKRTLKQMVMPIFYDVDPSDVRKQTGTFGEAFVKHEDRFLLDIDKIMSWRSALTEAANLSGWDLRKTADGHEAKFVRKILDDITGQLNRTYLSGAVYPVGINIRVHEMSNCLDVGLDDVRMVGIWGMGGMGKTTVAKAIYNQFYQSFEGTSFLANVREIAKQPNGLIHLQEQLLSDILKPTKIKVNSVDRGVNVIKERLASKRVLVIMDDIDQVDQLNAIARHRDWFGLGSRIIITTRDEHLLKQFEVDAKYLAPEMSEVEALELFSWHAFRNYCPDEVYHELSRSVVAYCGGLPLALEVLGSFLFGRSIPEWKSALEKLKRIPHRPIQEKLRISFDGLNDDNERDILLDISCFFIGMDKNYVNQILDGCGFSAEIGMSVLLQRSLVTVSERNKLMMHDLLRDMGRESIREKSPKELGKRSRLWHDKDATDVLENLSGTEEIEGLVLNLHRSDKVSFSAKAFVNMQRLRLLQLNYVQLTGGYKYFSKDLRWLCWHGFPLKSIPKDFYLRNLVSVDLTYSNLTHLWKDPGLLEKLKFLNLSHSHYLTHSPDFSKLPNLEQLILEDCKSLSKVHQSIGLLERLSLVNLKDCKLLKDLPRSLYKSKSIEILVLSGCLSFGNLDEDLGEMVSLTTLEADNTAIKKVPSTIGRLRNLRHLSLCGLKGSPSNSLTSLFRSWVLPRKIPESPNLLFPSLQGLNYLESLALEDCSLTDDAISNFDWSLPRIRNLSLSGNSFHTLPSLGSLFSLQKLCLDKCTNLHAIPDLPTILMELNANYCTALARTGNLSKMTRLSNTSLAYCPKLIEISNIGVPTLIPDSWIYLRLEGCRNITANLKDIILQGWNLCGAAGVLLPGNDIPEWFPYVDEGPEVVFEVPQFIGTLNGLIVCIVLSSCYRNEVFDKLQISIIDCTEGTFYVWRPVILISDEGTIEDQLWVGLEVWNEAACTFEAGCKFSVIVDFGPEFIVKKTGVSLVRDDNINGKKIRSLSVSTDYGLWMESSEDMAGPTHGYCILKAEPFLV